VLKGSVYLNKRTKKFAMERGERMRLDRNKYMLARARACMGQKELEAKGISKGTLCRALSGEIRPETAGRIAKALGCDVTEIIETEN
jgi:hypothetical protein